VRERAPEVAVAYWTSKDSDCSQATALNRLTPQGTRKNTFTRRNSGPERPAVFGPESMDAQDPARLPNSRILLIRSDRPRSGSVATCSRGRRFGHECVSACRGTLERRFSRVWGRLAWTGSAKRTDEPVAGREPTPCPQSFNAVGPSQRGKSSSERSAFLPGEGQHALAGFKRTFLIATTSGMPWTI
jgi:hypothetical protein